MGRRIRDLTQSEWHHVTNRGADRQDIFSADRDRELYEHLLADAFDRHAVELHAYALMTNHFHLLARSAGGGLSDAMRLLCARYASAYNARTEREGPLLTSRFHSVPILSDAQLSQTARYIHRNPLALAPAAALANYRWSSLGALVGRRPVPSWLSTGVVVDERTSPDRYLEWVLAPHPADQMPLNGLDPLQRATCDEIDQAVADAVSISAELLRTPNRLLDEARALAITIGVETRAAGAFELAERYGLSDPRSIRRIARRGRVLTADSASFAALRMRVLDRLRSAA